MEFNGKAVLVYLEEDNITKAYFRIKPLLSEDGPISAETLASLPDEGFLRIVPDRNEQHTFKDRMRGMCGLCLLDLRNQPAEANKIRTNKNYNPENGEKNQFIVYSDAVRAMEDDLFYQVVSQNEADKASTAYVYIRSGANMQGPVKKDNPVLPEDAKQLPPDSQELYSISVNGQELLFFWPRKAVKAEMITPVESNQEKPEEKKEAPVTALDQIQEINKQCLPQTANLLSSKPSDETYHKPAMPQQPLTGTKLYSPGQRNASIRRAHNPLMETVELQRYAAKQEAPGAVVNDSNALKDIENPVDAFKRILQHVCLNQEDSRHAVEIILSCPGMQQALSAAMACECKKLSISAMHSQLQELEAERLMLLMQLDDARKDMSSLKNEALKDLTAQETAALDALRSEQQALAQANEIQQNALSALNEMRIEAQETIEKAKNDGNTVLFTRMIGKKAEKDVLIKRLENAMKNTGFVCNEGDALSLLTAYALSPEAIYVHAANRMDAALAAKMFAGIFGAPVSLNLNEKNVLLAPGGNTPAFVRSHVKKDCTGVFLTDDMESKAHTIDCSAVLLPFAADLQAVPKNIEFFEPVCTCSLHAFLHESELSDETIHAIMALRTAIVGNPLPITAVRNALRFIAATQNIFKGGTAEAIDRAVCHFILPCYLFSNINKDALTQYLTDMPRASEIWNS